MSNELSTYEYKLSTILNILDGSKLYLPSSETNVFLSVACFIVNQLSINNVSYI